MNTKPITASGLIVYLTVVVCIFCFLLYEASQPFVPLEFHNGNAEYQP